MTPSKRTFRRVTAADAIITPTTAYAKAVATGADKRLSAILYCVSGTIQYCVLNAGSTTPVNLVMGQLGAGQGTEIAGEETVDIWVRAASAGTYCITELQQ